MSGGSMAALWNRLACCLTGHDYSIASDQKRMFVRCTSCGRTSPGLAIDKSLFRKGPDARLGEASGSRPGAGPSRFATQ